MHDERSDREARRAQSNREELVERIARILPDDGAHDPMKGLRLYRASAPTNLHHSVFTPAFCLIAQGSKEILAGDHRYRYDPYHYLLGTIELPTVSQVLEATTERPYLSLRLELDPALGSLWYERAVHAPAQRPGCLPVASRPAS